MTNEVWVYADFDMSESISLLGKAQTLARQSGGKTAAVCSRGSLDIHSLIHHGADIVYDLDVEGSSVVQAYNLYELCKEYLPEIILFPATVEYSSVAARTAAFLGTGLTADCIELTIDENNLLRQIRPAFGGGLIAEIYCKDRRPQMATVRPGIFPITFPDKRRTGEYIRYSPAVQLVDPIKLISFKNISTSYDLRESKIIVAGGKGVGSREGFQLLTRFAEKIGGLVGASRSAVDAGYADYNQQIGQTGISVSPELYFAVGISGSSQHIAGMNTAGKIIAVNTNPRAPIFDYADLAIVGEWKEIINDIMNRV
jgi:caffeyl-CoA reductase-Etf complex subunit CarE